MKFSRDSFLLITCVSTQISKKNNKQTVPVASSSKSRHKSREQGRSTSNKTVTNQKSDDKDKDKIKFAPFYSGKMNQQNTTYDTMKDHILKQIQKTYKFGLDLTSVLKKEEDYVDLDAF